MIRWLQFRWFCFYHEYCPRHRKPLDNISGVCWDCNGEYIKVKHQKLEAGKVRYGLSDKAAVKEGK